MLLAEQKADIREVREYIVRRVNMVVCPDKNHFLIGCLYNSGRVKFIHFEIFRLIIYFISNNSY